MAILTGCAQKPDLADSGDYDHQTQLQSLSDWQMKARVSIRTSQDAVTASLLWQQRPDTQLVELNGLLGQNYARIQVNPELASLRIEDKQTYEAPQIEQLMLQHLGYIIPVTAMTNWLKGSVEGVPSQQWSANDAGLVADLRDRGWQITYRRYDSFPGIKNMQLPSRLTLTNGRETIKIAVQSWSRL